MPQPKTAKNIKPPALDLILILLSATCSSYLCQGLPMILLLLQNQPVLVSYVEVHFHTFAHTATAAPFPALSTIATAHSTRDMSYPY